jgi:serine/threonine protein kinase
MAEFNTEESLSAALLHSGVVTTEQLQNAERTMERARGEGRNMRLGSALVQNGAFSMRQWEKIEEWIRAELEYAPRQLGHYKLVKLLGAGGMGAVYLADDELVRRQVAVKVLSRHFTREREAVSRFKREARAAVQLRHPNLVPAYEVGEENGLPFYVMEFCEGETLDAVLERQKTLPVMQVLDIGIQSARGLGYAHSQGVLHRDIKPGNIFLTREGIAKVLDLGLVKNLYDLRQSFQTMGGTTLGTPNYISPEQAQGKPDLDGRTDQYSLGATMYHLLTGIIPFDDPSPGATLLKQVTDQLPDPRDIRLDVTPAVITVLAKMMAKERNHRYANMEELAKDLDRLKHRAPPEARALEPRLTSIAPRMATTTLKRPGVPRPVKHSAYWWLALGGGLVAIAVLIVIALYLLSR